MTTLSTAPYKGTRDFYPEDMRIQRWMFDRMRECVKKFGYEEYDGPMLEPFELYAAKTGEEIVNQQLFWLMDKGERKLAVRPEMTPTLARMVAAKVQELPKPIRWFSIPNLWRYERPQRGRLREHWQLNVDVLGGNALLADAEILSVALDIMKAFGGEKKVAIKVNHRKLVDQFFSHELGLSSEISLKAFKAIDARAKIGEETYAKWIDELGMSDTQRSRMEKFFQSSFEEVAEAVREMGAGVKELRELFRLLEESGIKSQVEFDPTILRGMDYYTGTVFEIYDTSPENRRAMFGGGRYDNLIGLFGKQQLSGVGFGMGDVGFRNFLEVHGLLPKLSGQAEVFVGMPSLNERAHSEGIARGLREVGIQVVTPLESGSFGDQLKLATKLGARFAVLLGERELAEKKVVVKDLVARAQEEVLISQIAEVMKRKCSQS